MLRRILYYSAAVSLMLWLTLWAGWAVAKYRPSLRHRVWIGLEFHSTAYHLRFTRSGVMLTRTTFLPNESWTAPMDYPALIKWQQYHLSFERRGQIFACDLWRGSHLFEFHNIAPAVFVGRLTGMETVLHVPRWLASLATMMLPLVAAVRILKPRVKRALVRDGCCLNCGYDLRASHDRCPECGTPIETTVSQSVTKMP